VLCLMCWHGGGVVGLAAARLRCALDCLLVVWCLIPCSVRV
jgi:hypothetical protein